MDVREYQKEYHRHYYRDVRGPKDKANKALDAAVCQICGDEWASTHAGWNAAIFVCVYCDNKLSKWDQEKEEKATLCQVCHLEPVIGLHESSLLRCCCGCLVWLSEGEAEGCQRWKPAKDSPWDTDEKLGHLFESGTQFHEPPAATALCGVKAPVWDIAIDMETPAAVRRWGLCVACVKACPEPVGISHWDRGDYFAYVVPTSQEIGPAVGTS